MLTAMTRNDNYQKAELCSTHRNQDKLEPGPAEVTHDISITRPRKIDMVNNVCFCASETMRSRTAY